jgi:hypothetical protein
VHGVVGTIARFCVHVNSLIRAFPPQWPFEDAGMRPIFARTDKQVYAEDLKQAVRHVLDLTGFSVRSLAHLLCAAKDFKAGFVPEKICADSRNRR